MTEAKGNEDYQRVKEEATSELRAATVVAFMPLARALRSNY
jgi:hypothetical protein